MSDSVRVQADTEEFEKDAAYAWWLNTHPNGFVLAVHPRRPPMLHKARCKDVDRDRRPGRLKGAGSRQICADSKASLRDWAKRELPTSSTMLDRCSKCAP
jgi:hypothetical protein